MKLHLLLPFPLTTSIFDYLEERWESPRTRRSVANLLVAAFLLTLLAIELNRQQLLPTGLASLIPVNHFYAIKLAFDLLLIIEILGLVFSLASSVADAMGKQFEILSLILLRQSFKEFTHFTEPLEWENISSSVWYVLSDAGGALTIFWLVLVYYRLQRHKRISDVDEDRVSFVSVKKAVALMLLTLFVAIGIHDVITWWRTGEGYSFFSIFYLTLIFSDILIVLISLRYSNVYGIVFRNSGFAVATVLIRLALTAPPFINVLLGLASIGLGIGLTLAYNYFQSLPVAKPVEKYAD
jgi:hypothetical protein